MIMIVDFRCVWNGFSVLVPYFKPQFHFGLELEGFYVI